MNKEKAKAAFSKTFSDIGSAIGIFVVIIVGLFALGKIIEWLGAWFFIIAILGIFVSVFADNYSNLKS